jgi:hypothetical protein
MAEQGRLPLEKLSEPFPADDIEWRVSRAGMGKQGVYCHCLAYITARAIQSRLDKVCGPENWRNETPEVKELRPGVVAMLCGISIRIEGEWVTKWDVAEPTNIEPAKGGFSGAMKRAGAQWGIGRYLYHLDETFAEVADTGGRGWNWAQLPEKHGGATYYWKPPTLPAWALPKEPEHEINAADLNNLKRAWREKFAPDVKNQAELLEGFTRFVTSICGEFPSSDYTCWTSDAYDRCEKRIKETTEPGGVSADVPFSA